MDLSGGYCENPFVVEFYDHIIKHRESHDIGFFIDFARKSRAEVLELGCGTGRVLIDLAKGGVRITGLDVFSAMLARCKQKLLSENQNARSMVVDLVLGDMRSFSLGQTFGLITIPFYSFNYLLTVEEQVSCLSCVHKHLKSDGKLIVVLPNPYLPYLIDDRYLREFGDEPEFEMSDGRRVRRRFQIKTRDLSRQVVQAETIYYIAHADGVQERLVNDLSIRYLFRYEAEHLVARCGFVVEAIYGDYDKGSFGCQDLGELIIIASRSDST